MIDPADSSKRSAKQIRVKGYKAWLVRWVWIGDHAKVDDPIIAILSPRLGVHEVRSFVERHYAATTYTPSEKLHFMRHPELNPYKATLGAVEVTMEDGRVSHLPWSGEVVCGHNPFIHASLVAGLRDTAADDPGEGVTWTAQSRPIMDLRHTPDAGSLAARSTENTFD